MTRIEPSLPTNDEVFGLTFERETSADALVQLLTMATRVRRTRTALAALLALAARGALPNDERISALLPQLDDWRAFAWATLALGDRMRGLLRTLLAAGKLSQRQMMISLYVRARSYEHRIAATDDDLSAAVLDLFLGSDDALDLAFADDLRTLVARALGKPIVEWLPRPEAVKSGAEVASR